MLMDDLDVRSKSDQGAEYHLRSHINDEPLFDDGKPLIVLVRGTTGPQAQNGLRAALRVAREWKDAAGSVEVMEDFQAYLVAQAKPFIAGFRNIERAPGEPATEADAERFLNLNLYRSPTVDADGNVLPGQGRCYAKQILDFLGEADRELGNG